MSVFLLILGIVLFIGLVVVHEWGHFIAARQGGVEVDEFGIGFPPTVWSKKVKTAKSKFLFTINLLPLGGFVRLKGENDSATEKGSYGAAPLSTKVKIMLAGVAMNLIVAFGLLTIVALMGMPKLIDSQFTVQSDTTYSQPPQIFAEKISENSPAARAGLQPGDRLVSINNIETNSLSTVERTSRSLAGQTAPVVIERNGKTETRQVTLNSENTDKIYLGVTSRQEGIQTQRNTWSAPIVAAGLIKQFTELTFKGLGTAVSSLFQGDTKTASEQVSGPIGIVVILKEGSEVGMNFVLMITAIISLSLAIMNVLPIPALDGGRLFVTLAFRAFKRPLTKTREEWIHGTGFVALIGLFILITIVDVKRFL